MGWTSRNALAGDRTGRRALAVLGAAATVAAGLSPLAVAAPASAAPPSASPATAAASSPETISADALPTPQVDGVVFSVAVVGNTAYAAGRFTKARPSGSAAGGADEVTRTNLLAFDLTTGALLPFNHTITGAPFTSTTNPGPFCESTGVTNQYVCDAVYRVKASADGSKLYIVGDFTAVDGVGRYRVAAFDTATGTLDPKFKPAASSRVRAIAVGTNAVYLGGAFSSVSGVPETRLTAVDLTGKVIPGFVASADKDVWAAALTSGQDRLVVGGQFTSLSGAAKLGLGAVSALDGSAAAWSSQPVQRHASNGKTGYVTDLQVAGDIVYASGADFAGYPAFEGRLAADAATGDLIWLDQCHGDTQSIAVAGGVVYSVSHGHDCSMMNGWTQTTPTTYQRILAETATASAVNGMGESIPQILTAFPNTDGGPATSYWKNGPWAVAADGVNVVVGGEFLTVNGVAQQGLTRFRVRSASPHKSGPQGVSTPTVTSVRAGTATVSWPASWDRDDATLGYQVLRDGKQVALVSASSTFWSRPTMAWVDAAAGDGLPHTYRVRAIDPDGNVAGSPTSASITVAPATDADRLLGTDYAGAVSRDGAVHAWRLDEAPGATTAADAAGSAPLALATGTTLGVAGITGKDGDPAAQFDGSATASAATTTAEVAPQVFSVEAWVSTTSRSGGKIVGFGNRSTGVSTSYDRQIWMTTDGRLNAGVYNGAVQAIITVRTYNDGTWHHVVLTMGPAGLSFYVDGALVATKAGVTSAERTYGYWRVGGDNLSGWVSGWPAITGTWTASNNLAGSIDEVAVYSQPLSAAQVTDHFLRGVS